MSASFRSGAWRVAGARELFEAARAALERAARERATERGPRRLGGLETYFKGSRLALGPALRHGLRRVLLRAEIPRLQEFENLTWLRAHGFLAPRPVLAGVFTRLGLPRYQFLFSEHVRDSPDVGEFLPDATRAQREALVASLARDLAGLHALGFVHCDLFPRNLLACLTPDGPRCAFLDTWRAASCCAV